MADSGMTFEYNGSPSFLRVLVVHPPPAVLLSACPNFKYTCGT